MLVHDTGTGVAGQIWQVVLFGRERGEGCFAVQPSLMVSDRRMLTDLKQSVNRVLLIIVNANTNLTPILYHISEKAVHWSK
jgi:hypothetical protein